MTSKAEMENVNIIIELPIRTQASIRGNKKVISFSLYPTADFQGSTLLAVVDGLMHGFQEKTGLKIRAEVQGTITEDYAPFRQNLENRG